MAQDLQPSSQDLHRAATTAFDFYNPSHALGELLRLANELLHADRAALYEYTEGESSYIARFSDGIPMADLGRLAAAADHPVLRKVFDEKRAATSDDSRSALGLPLAPGYVACAPCSNGDHMIGLIFVARDRGGEFNPPELGTLEVLATRAAEVLAFARQTANQSYLFHKLSLLYQASHAITGTHDRQEAVRQTAAHLLKATSADICEVLVFDEGDGYTTRFRQQLGKSIQHTVVSLVSESMPDYPVHKEVLKNLRPVTLNLQPPVGTAKDIAMLQSEGISAAAIFPLATRNEALGLVRVLYHQPGRQINDQEMELAQAIINIGAVGLQDAIHLETATDRANQLQV
ncbi:MAG TPA: GAF domain-containing protein, partial [Anaerolineales bacterium]